MEVDRQINLNELLKDLKKKAQNNHNHGEVVNQLLNYYLYLEKTDQFTSIAASCLILLLCIQGDFEEASSRKTKYKNLKFFHTNEDFTQLFSISKRFIREPYCDLFTHIYFFVRSVSPEINQIASAYLSIYERQQAAYLSKFYSKIKISTFKKLQGSNFQEEKLEEYLNRYGWILKNEFIVTAPVQVNFDSYQLKEDLDFINKMTVSLENIAKANSSLKPLDF